MPEVAGIAQADGLAVLLDVRDDQHLGVARELEFLLHVDLQRPEAAAERDLLRGRDALVAEHEHMVVEVCAVDAREILVGQRAAQVQADHFGAEGRVEGADDEAGLGRGGIGPDGRRGEGGHGAGRRRTPRGEALHSRQRMPPRERLIFRLLTTQTSKTASRCERAAHAAGLQAKSSRNAHPVGASSYQFRSVTPRP